MSRSWHLTASDSLIWKYWEGEAVVFDERTGDTSYIDCIHMEIVRLLRDGMADEAELHERIAALLECPPGPELDSCVAAACEHLRRLDIIEPVIA